MKVFVLAYLEERLKFRRRNVKLVLISAEKGWFSQIPIGLLHIAKMVILSFI